MKYLLDLGRASAHTLCMKNTTLGQFIRALRLQRGLTQEILAKNVGIATTHLSTIERDKHLPQEATSALLLDALRMEKEFTRSEREFANTKMRLPEGYSWDAPDKSRMLTWDFIETHKQSGYGYWVNHCVREMALQVGQEELLDILLKAATAKGITIPETPSM